MKKEKGKKEVKEEEEEEGDKKVITVSIMEMIKRKVGGG